MTKKQVIAHIDGDILVYKVGWACQKNKVSLVYDCGKSEQFNNKSEAYMYAEEYGITDYEIVLDRSIVEPDNWAYKTAKRLIQRICKGVGARKYRIYIDGKNNFRDSIVAPIKYKDRSGGKPVLYDKLRAYLLDYHSACVVDDIEVDDVISIWTYHGYKNNTKHVGCTTDKDALNTPGWLYNWDKMGKPVYIERMDALKSFYKQLLSGDPVDTIRGCRGIGKKGKALLAIEGMDSQKDMYQFCLNQYVKASKAEDTLTPEQELEANAHLLWMLRKPLEFDSDGKTILQWQAPL